MKKKNILGLIVLSSLMAVAGLTSLNKVTRDSVGVHAETSSTEAATPDGWSKEGEDANNTISAFKDATEGNSILLKRTSAEGTLKARTGLIAVKANTYYNVSFKTKTTDSASVQINIVEYDNNGGALNSFAVSKVSTATGSWVSRPGMFKTSAAATQIVVEIEALGTGETYVSKLRINEGVEPDGKISSRTKYFEGDAANAETGMNTKKAITTDVLSSDAATGYSALKLVPGRGVYLEFDDYKITGKFTLRFKYKYIGGTSSSVDGYTGTNLTVKLDGVNKAGKRVWYGDSPRDGWTPNGLWDTYEYEFSAKSGEAEPVFVVIYAGLQDTSKTSDSYYLIDDVEVIDEHGNNVVEDGDFELKENALPNTIAYYDFTGSVEANWGANDFITAPSSIYINDGYNDTRAVHLSANKALGFSLPILPYGKYTLSYKYRTANAGSLSIRMDNYNSANNRAYYATPTVVNTNGKWVDDSYSFSTRISDSDYCDTSFLVLNAKADIDIDNVSIKDESGKEFVIAGTFDTFMAGGDYVNNTDAFKDENGNIVYASLRKLAMVSTVTSESYVRLNLASLGLNSFAAGQKVNVSYEYLGGTDGHCAPFSDQNKWYLDNANRTVEWTKREAQIETTYAGGFNNQELRVYGNNYDGTEKNVYLRNISVTDSDGNEYFHPYANGTSILPQGGFAVNEDKTAVDEFVAAYITNQGAEDYTTIDESKRAKTCSDKLSKAQGALKRLTDAQKELFNTSDDYAEARRIMDTWKALTNSSASIGVFGNNNSNSTAALVITVLTISAVAISTFALVRKKKHN